MKYDAFIVIDMQTALIEAHPYNEITVVANVKQLLQISRAKGIPVIYIQHDGGSGDELEKECAGWKIWEEITPLPGEMIFDKMYNSAFRKTGLQEYLTQIGAQNIILCGMQTEHCFDASCKVAFEYGYHVTIAKDTTTTFDSDFTSGKKLAEYYENKIWNNRYASVISMEQMMSELNDTNE